MRPTVSRRALLAALLKSGIGLAIWRQLDVGILPAFAMSPLPIRQSNSQFQRAFAHLDEFIAAHMRDVGAPGLTLALATRDGLLRFSNYGFRDVKRGIKVGPDTLFEIGSISKSFVALALMQMHEEGIFDPGKPITTYLPWLKIDSKYAPITGHHLLSHTSGLPGGVSLELIGLDQPLWTGFAPGERFVYSNIGYDLLGLTLEAIDHQPMAAVIRKRVLEPLGMIASEPIITNASRSRLAIGYAPMFDDRPFPLRGPLAEAPWMQFAEGAGSIASTATDMVAYLAMLINRGSTIASQGSSRKRIVTENTFKSITTPIINAPFRGEPASYGYGLWVSEIDGHATLRHTGGMVAFSSALHVDLTSGIGAFASVNANLAGYRPVVVTKYALDLVRATIDGKTWPSAPGTTTSPDQVANALEYVSPFTSTDGEELVLGAEGGKLWLVAGTQRVALERTGNERFIVKHPRFELYQLEFARQNGAVVEAFHGPRWFTNESYAGPKTFDYPKTWDAFAGHYRCESPWFGSTRVFVRKGKLTLDGTALTPSTDGLFRLGEEWSPERVSFGPIVNGHATHMKFSGVDHYRTTLP
jgi:CubicO group peptidase (beta-lactamase class C family)